MWLHFNMNPPAPKVNSHGVYFLFVVDLGFDLRTFLDIELQEFLTLHQNWQIGWN